MNQIPAIFNIGYQGRSVQDFCTVLERAGVEVLVDVRAIAWSQRPQFRKTALANALATSGIDYFHCKVAGNPYRNHDDWRTCRKLYTQHLHDNPDVLITLADALSSRTAALFCYEAERTSCHRGVLVEFLRRSHPRHSFIDL